MTRRSTADVAGLHRSHPTPHRKTTGFKYSHLLSRVSLFLAIAGVLAVAATAAYFLQR